MPPPRSTRPSSSPRRAPTSGSSTRWRAGCSLYTGSHYFHTPEADSKVDKDNPTQVGRALRQLGCIAACSPEARGRRMFAALQKRLPQELRLATDIDEANRFLQQVYLPGHNRRFATPPEGLGLRALRRYPGRHPLPRNAPSPTTTPCARRCLQLPTDRHHTTSRPGFGSPRPHPRHLPRTPRPLPQRRPTPPHPRGCVTRFDATERCPVGKWLGA